MAPPSERPNPTTRFGAWAWSSLVLGYKTVYSEEEKVVSLQNSFQRASSPVWRIAISRHDCTATSRHGCTATSSH
eukprot:3941928-Rhodomonas_salina.8